MPGVPADPYPRPPRRRQRHAVAPPQPDQWPEDSGASLAPGWLVALGIGLVAAGIGTGVVAFRSLPEHQPAAQPAWAQTAPQPPAPPARPAPEPIRALEPSEVPGPRGEDPARFAGADAAPRPTVAAAPPDAVSADGAILGAVPTLEADEPATALPPSRAAPPAATRGTTEAEVLSPPSALVAAPPTSMEGASDCPGTTRRPATLRDASQDDGPSPARNANPAQPGAGVPVARPATPEPDSKATARAGEAERRVPAASSAPPALVEALIARGDAMVARRDISAARLFYQRAAAGDARAASALARTYDPAFLAEIGAQGIRGDATLASAWYRTAIALGDSSAQARVEALNGPDRSAQGRP